MCTLGEEYCEGAAAYPLDDLPSSYPKEGKCKMCDRVGLLYKPGFREPECADCFLFTCNRLFRNAISCTKTVPRCAKIMIVFDGTAEAVALLDFLHNALTGNTFKRVHFIVNILHIDDFMEIDRYATREQHHKYLNDVRDLLNNYQIFSRYIISQRGDVDSLFEFKHLEQYKCRPEEPEENDVADCVSPHEILRVKHEYIKYKRIRLISGVAKKLNCKYVFLADIITSIAEQMVNDFCLSSSGNVSVELLDDRLDGCISLIRPIKDFNILEILLYLKLKNIKVLRTQRFGEKKSASGNLINLTKQFVDNVHMNYSLKESIFGKDQKTVQHKDSSSDSCTFCNTSANYIYSETLLAIEISRYITKEAERLTHSNAQIIDEDGLIKEMNNFVLDDEEEQY